MSLGQVLVFSSILGTAVIPLLAAQPQTARPAAQTRNNSAATMHVYQQRQDEGQRLFEVHCSRCHTAPEGFSQSISGTVVRHMRVRASLSKHEEEELLRFFNP
ncbi:MAG TPA: cytochrome c [Pseudacidobacterium sp.]|jgi:mono/diheme cytochrome c family protein|nr:cytochrome c [Pseudacidobacterium sp.]